MPERREPDEFLAPFITKDDGLPTRKSGRWAKDKLGILAMYLPRFVQASMKARAAYFVDGLAGPGLCRIEATAEFVHGSTLIALRSNPELTRCISMDMNVSAVRALRRRTAAYGDRSVVAHGNVNSDLLPLMESTIEKRGAPTLVFLDPEGFEVDWATIKAISQFRTGPRKAEQLILAMTSAIPRVAAARDPLRGAGHLEWALPPGPQWQEIVDRLRDGELKPGEARSAWAELYTRQLKEELGYRHAMARAITARGDPTDASIYHLVFASDHDAGYQIMSHAFERMWVNRSALSSGGQSSQLRLDL
jgi:three-Cys-motif partner protein